MQIFLYHVERRRFNLLAHREGPITFDYDPKFDTLYASINGKDKSHSYGDDRVPGLLVARDMDTDEITGFTIFRYIKSNLERTREMLESYFSCYEKSNGQIEPYLNLLHEKLQHIPKRVPIVIPKQTNKSVLFLCDGAVGSCPKTNCYKRSGECRHTLNKNHALNSEPHNFLPDEAGNLWEAES